ncbi:MAG: response regulator transcription factor [bacterium]|jgi:two-component system OmpR family response regulator
MIKAVMIEDDREIAELLKEYLRKFNIDLTNFENAEEGLNGIIKKKDEGFDILILDLTLPDMDGLEICKTVSEACNIPIIISSARGDYSDIVTGLEIGADDYVAKPYNPRELVARIRSLIRRKTGLKSETKLFEIDESKMIIKKDGKPLDFTSAEYELFLTLYKNRGSVITRDFILENIKTMSYESIDRSVDVLIGRIRKKIGDDPKNPIYIKSIRGYGYKFYED